jgi:hypothetical protein
MTTVRIADVVVPDQFTAYVVDNSVEKTALYESGVVRRNGQIVTQLQAGADSFTVPFWRDLANDEANVASDDPNVDAVPHALGTGRQLVRKAFLHNSWSAMNLASELSGGDALVRIQDRATAYWGRQFQRRLIASLRGVLADNVANDGGDMVHDISAGVGAAAVFNATAVIEAALTLGDQVDALRAIAVHSDIYGVMLKADLIQYVPDSQGGLIRTYRGLSVIVDDGLPVSGGNYTTALFGNNAVNFAMTAPRIAQGTEVENKPSSGNGGGQQILHSRVNLACHPAGFSWVEGSVTAESPTIAELALAANWNRILDRKAIPIAFLIAKAVAV